VGAATADDGQANEPAAAAEGDLVLVVRTLVGEISVTVSATNTVDQLAEKVAGHMEETELDRLRFAIVGQEGEPLEDETMTMEDYGVGPGTQLMVSAQDPAAAAQRREERRARRGGLLEAQKRRVVCKMRSCQCLLLAGMATLPV
jgi:hypothetical protein